MAIEANFGGVKYIDVTGYKISCCFQASNGIQDAFFIYLEQVISTKNKFSAVDMDSPAPADGPKRGTLTIKDNESYRDYSFDDIDLVSYQIHFSHYRKVRLLTFRYDPMITNAGQFCTMTNNQESKPVNEFNNTFAQDYQYSIQGQGFSESLLSVSSKFSRNSKEYIRFGALRNKQNSFMKLVLDLDIERKTGITPKTITYKGQQTTINKTNFDAIIVDETYGSFLKYSLPNLDVISQSTQYPALLNIEYDPLNPFEYLQHAEAPATDGSIIDNTMASSIETAVLILKNGVFLDHAKEMV